MTIDGHPAPIPHPEASVLTGFCEVACSLLAFFHRNINRADQVFQSQFVFKNRTKFFLNFFIYFLPGFPGLQRISQQVFSHLGRGIVKAQDKFSGAVWRSVGVGDDDLLPADGFAGVGESHGRQVFVSL